MKNYIPVQENSNVTHIKVEVKYDLGGYSFATYREKPRGYYLYVTPVKREEKYGCMMESFTAFTGYSYFLKDVKRKSAKAEAEAESIAKTVMDQMISKVCKEQGLTLA